MTIPPDLLNLMTPKSGNTLPGAGKLFLLLGRPSVPGGAFDDDHYKDDDILCGFTSEENANRSKKALIADKILELELDRDFEAPTPNSLFWMVWLYEGNVRTPQCSQISAYEAVGHAPNWRPSVTNEHVTEGKCTELKVWAEDRASAIEEARRVLAELKSSNRWTDDWRIWYKRITADFTNSKQLAATEALRAPRID